LFLVDASSKEIFKTVAEKVNIREKCLAERREELHIQTCKFNGLVLGGTATVLSGD
jgi:hypothetical protein